MSNVRRGARWWKIMAINYSATSIAQFTYMILVMSSLIGEGMEGVTKVTHHIPAENCFKNNITYQRQKNTCASQ